jgi:hypothetical protein
MQNKEVIAIVATLGLLLSVCALYSQNAFAQISNPGSANGSISGTGGASSGTGSYNSNGGLGGNTGQTGAGGGSSGATIGGGNTGQSVDRHLFCNTGVITPICK